MIGDTFSSNSLSLVLFIPPRCCILVFIPSVYPSHVARSEDAGLPKSFSMVSIVFKSTVNNLAFFFLKHRLLYLLSVSIINELSFLTVTGSFIPEAGHSVI